MTRIKRITASYVCDTCHRTIKVPEVVGGITTIGNCTITNGCSGKLLPITNAADARSAPSIPPDVAGVANYIPREVLQRHVQTVAASVWQFNYTLFGTPMIHVFVGEDRQDTVEYQSAISNGVITITLPTPSVGEVVCTAVNGRGYAAPALTTDTDTTLTQLSNNNGDITIATLESTAVVGVTINFVSASSSTVIEYFNIEVGAGVASPWANVSHVVINGKRYFVRSFNIHTAASAVEYFSTNIVSTGSSMQVAAVGSKPIVPGNAVVLLSAPPHNYVDRIYDRVVDVTSIASKTSALFYANGKAYLSSDVAKTVYPNILITQ